MPDYIEKVFKHRSLLGPAVYCPNPLQARHIPSTWSPLLPLRFPKSKSDAVCTMPAVSTHPHLIKAVCLPPHRLSTAAGYDMLPPSLCAVSRQPNYLPCLPYYMTFKIQSDALNLSCCSPYFVPYRIPSRRSAGPENVPFQLHPTPKWVRTDSAYLLLPSEPIERNSRKLKNIDLNSETGFILLQK